MKISYLSNCRLRIYNVCRFVQDNKFIKDLFGIKYHDFNSPEAFYPRARVSRACGGMQSTARPYTEPSR